MKSYVKTAESRGVGAVASADLIARHRPGQIGRSMRIDKAGEIIVPVKHRQSFNRRSPDGRVKATLLSRPAVFPSAGLIREGLSGMYYSDLGVDPLGTPPKTSTPIKFTGGTGTGTTSKSTDYGSLVGQSIDYLTARQKRQQAEAEAKAAAARAASSVVSGGMGQYTPFIIGGAALVAVILLMKKKS